MSRSALPTYAQISVGEPDANAEYFAALRTRQSPVFLENFFALPHFALDDMLAGKKYLVYGQKGTGKTAILRYIQKRQAIANSEFLIFKKSFLEETDIQDVSHLSLMLDEDEIKSFKHYYHALKRIVTLLLINQFYKRQVSDDDISELENQADRSLVQRISNSSTANVIRLGFDSIASIFKASGVDIEKVTSKKALVDSARLLKRNNDDLLNFLVRQVRNSPKPLRLYLDEIHFAYRNEESLQQDAILVRDTILVVQALNERFATESMDSIIYAAVRAEYLEHPIISTADINHAIESVGLSVSWSAFPLTKQHPLFDLIIERFKSSAGAGFNRSEFFVRYLKNVDPVVFLERTWSKPRDVVRFFKCAKGLYPNKVVLTVGEVNAVWRDYAHESWRELKSAAAAFLPPDAISKFESVLSGLTPNLYDGSMKLDIVSFGKYMKPVYELAKNKHSNFYDFEHFLRLLYILGIFLTRRRDANDQDIYQSYHRGNRNFHANGDVMIHPTVLKAFG